MIKLICFDLDGVLVDSKPTHYHALNMALNEVDKKYTISFDEHLLKYDGLPTHKKLEKLKVDKQLPEEHFKKIWNRKQELTVEVIKKIINPDINLTNLFKKLKDDNYKIVVCSNSIRHTTKMYILKLGLFEYVDAYYSNEDVKFPKPHPSIYLKAMLDFNMSPNETLIIEDSHVGITAAVGSGANVLIVQNTNDVNIDNIYNKLNNITLKKHKWQGKKMNILIPMAGAGSRFSIAGYTFPKPLIEVCGKPMIQVVVDNLNIDANYVYVVRKEHYEKYNLKNMLNIITPNCNIVCVDSLTEGAACTTLLAEEYINTDEPLLIANSDQFIEWDSIEFMYNMTSGQCDGGILTFKNTHPKWSYVKVDENNYVTELREKQVISDIATVGIYYWTHGKDYVHYAKNMINKNIRVNNEFYVAPVFNEAISDGKKIKKYDIERMWGLGTPEDLKYFIDNFKGKL